MIDPQEVEKIFVDCLFRKEEVVDNKPPEGAIIVEGIIQKFAFHPQRIEKHRSRIIELLSELPLQFRKSGGGGWSFLNACNTKDGKLWTGLHLRMEQLFALGIAIGKARFQMPRDIWHIFPGGMPYVVIDL